VRKLDTITDDNWCSIVLAEDSQTSCSLQAGGVSGTWRPATVPWGLHWGSTAMHTASHTTLYPMSARSMW